MSYSDPLNCFRAHHNSDLLSLSSSYLNSSKVYDKIRCIKNAHLRLISFKPKHLILHSNI